LKIKSKFHLLAISTLTFGLYACSGGSGSPEPSKPTPPIPSPVETTSNTGKVIGGSVSGATVWLDLNGDGKFDDQNEPFAISAEGGDYTLNLTSTQQTCFPYRALYVDVPVGAIDDTFGEVIQAYQMSLPPSISRISNTETRIISPLTTLLWQAIESQFKQTRNTSPVDCVMAENDEAIRTRINSQFETVMANFTRFYNISAEQVFDDFMANNDVEATELALKTMKISKVSHAYGLELQNLHVNSTDVDVVIYQDIAQSNEPEQWLRFSRVISNNPIEDLIEVVVLTPDLTEVEQALSYQFRSQGDWNGGYIDMGVLIYYHASEQIWTCSSYEGLRYTHDGIDFTFSNRSESAMESNYDNCQSVVDGNGSERQYNFMYADETASVNYVTNFTITNDDAEYTALGAWHNIKDKETELAMSDLVDYLLSTPYQFADDVGLNINRWHKLKFFNDENSYDVTLEKSGEKGSDEIQWRKTTSNASFFSPGTTTVECSMDGENWLPCEG
tara:strand:- start:805 stop:2313 length:1509 start_codon:yes stop_codon:yes gene_type:complete